MVDFLFHKVTKSDSTSATSNEQILQRVTSDFLQRATSARSKEGILKRETSDFTTSNKQRVKLRLHQKVYIHIFLPSKPN